MTISEKTQNHDYISKYWEILGACAWREYQAHGRGAVLVGGFDDPEDYIYIPSDLLSTAPLLKDFVQFTKTYDPRREIVVIFLGEPPAVSAYKGGIPERGTPPELYERLKTVLYEN